MRTKWRLRHPETPVELSVSLFDSLGEFICGKGSSSIGYRVDWCINHRLQSNQFVGRPDEEKEKDGENDRFPCILATLGVLLGRESLANPDQIPKKGFICTCEGFSYVWRHRRVRAIPT